MKYQTNDYILNEFSKFKTTNVIVPIKFKPSRINMILNPDIKEWASKCRLQYFQQLNGVKPSTIQKYKEYQNSGVLYPMNFRIPERGWDVDDFCKWKHKCKILYNKPILESSKQDRLKLRVDTGINHHRHKRIRDQYELFLTNGVFVPKCCRKPVCGWEDTAFHMWLKECDRLGESESRLKRKQKIQNFNKHKLATDPMFRFIIGIKTRVKAQFNSSGLQKNSKTKLILGCSFEDFRIHIKNQFLDNMTIENWGEIWHIDHIIPVQAARWQPGTIEELQQRVIKLNHYTNLQPLYSYKNLEKKDKILNLEQAAKFDWIDLTKINDVGEFVGQKY